MTPNPEPQDLISIIIPAYNSGKYIETTLNNLFAQTYQNFEIIIAYDEKSTDNSLKLLQKINEEHPITIDIGKDTSSGTARNRGFRLAKGEYVIFVDADDEILPDYLERMHRLFTEHPDIDIANCGYLYVTNENITQKRIVAEKSNASTKIKTKEEAFIMFTYGELPGVPWAYLIKRKLLVDNNIIFPNYSHGDDSVFIARTLAVASNIGICEKKLYLFRQHSASITHTLPENWEKLFLPSQTEISQILEKYHPDLEIIYNLRITYWGIADGVKRYERYPEFKNRVEQLLKPYEVNRIPLSIEKKSITKKIAIACFNTSWRLYYTLHSIYYKLQVTVS